MSPLSNDEFFAKLGELFASRKGKDHGGVRLSQKRMDYGLELPKPSAANPFPDLQLDNPVPVLIRATNGKSGDAKKDKIKLSTLVEADALDAFYLKYAEVCKAGMAALKPRDRSKKKAKARSKKKVAVPAPATTA